MAAENGHAPGLVFRTRRRSFAGEMVDFGQARGHADPARLGS
ncbi:MAG: hypothetical protein ABW135_08670 [Thermoleophilaceae bacterium]